ncbi:hypothetical protein ACWCZ5_17400 [Streptomyces sp. NPDC001667]
MGDVIGDHAEKKAREGDDRYADYGGPVAAKLRTELTGVQAEIAEYKAKVARYEAAAQVGIPLMHADRLRGETPDELAADASQLAKEFGAGRIKSRPTPTVGGGADAADNTSALDPMRLATAVLSRIKGH